MRKTKIVATVGPACEDPRVLKMLIREGVDVFRINASHSNPKGLVEWFARIRKASKELKENPAILVDLQGPRVRTGPLVNSPLFLTAGQTVTIEIGRHAGHDNTITTSCALFARMVKKADPILLDNGAIKLEVKEVRKKSVVCRVIQGGRLGENKGINLPNAPVTLPALTPKDLVDLKAAASLGADYVALSFVRSADDIQTIKKWMFGRRMHIPVIAKIEKPKAVDGIRAILERADGIMVARGDLGIEMGVAKVPSVQKTLIEQAIQAKIPVITATQMLETMMENPHPSRAEVSDIANAVFDGTDAVMLSGETAIGKYPVECVRTMREIIEEAEKNRKIPSSEDLKPKDRSMINLRAVTQAALYAARELEAKAIIVFTLSGKTAQYVSKLNPQCLVLAVSRMAKTVSQLHLLRGVHPILIQGHFNMDDMIRKAEQEALKKKILKKGDAVILVYGRRALPGMLYTTAVHYLGHKLN